MNGILDSCTRACGRSITGIVVATANKHADEKAWVDGALDLMSQGSHAAVDYLTVMTFGHMLEVATVHETDQRTLMWLSALYSKLRLNDDQMANLPFSFNAETPNAQCMSYLWTHLRVITHTLRELSALYAAGYIHLMSRAAAAGLCNSQADYVLRLSNKEPGTMVITTHTGHIYLDAKPGYDVERKNVQVGRNQLPVFVWTLANIKRLLQYSGLTTCRFGTAVPIEQVNDQYASVVRSNYASYRQIESSQYPSLRPAAAAAADVPPPPYPDE